MAWAVVERSFRTPVGRRRVVVAVAMAGGPSRFAALNKVVLIRPTPRGPRRIPIDLGAIYAGTRPEMNIVLIRGDTLHLP